MGYSQRKGRADWPQSWRGGLVRAGAWSRSRSWLGLVLAVTSIVVAQAAGITTGDLSVKRMTVEVCAECHGPDGNSRYPWVPNLAAQNADYLFVQLQRFRQRQRLDHIMNDIVDALDDEQLRRLSEHYAALPNAPIRMPGIGNAKRGERIYADRCVDCHGRDGRGQAGVAWIAGQQPEYVRLSLRRYRDGLKSRNNLLMREATRGLGESEIADLAAYLATLR